MDPSLDSTCGSPADIIFENNSAYGLSTVTVMDLKTNSAYGLPTDITLKTNSAYGVPTDMDLDTNSSHQQPAVPEDDAYIFMDPSPDSTSESDMVLENNSVWLAC